MGENIFVLCLIFCFCFPLCSPPLFVTQRYVTIAMKTAGLLLTSFGPMIKSTIAAPAGYGVDVSREER